MFDDLIPAGGAGDGPVTSSGSDQPPRLAIVKQPWQVAPDMPQEAAPQLSPRDRNLIARTILGEAAGEEDDGQRAVAAVILNRLKSGKFGGSIPQIVAAKNQFEPWMTPEGRSRMLGYAEEGPEYQRALANLEALLAGQSPDPTGGATHFYAPKAQAALGREPPKWAAGLEPAVIGNHYFFTPDGQAAKKPVQVASSNRTFVPEAPAAAQPKPAAAGMFSDLVPAQDGAEPAPSLLERFSGEGMSTPTADAEKLATGLRKTADKDLVTRAYGYEPSQAEQSFDTIVAELANTFLMNVPRNIGAAYLSHKYDVPFDEAYDKLKAFEEARSRENPKSSVAGTVGGVTAGLLTLPSVKLGGLGKTVAGRAVEAGATGAAYGVTSELLDSKDPVKASVAAALGAALGGIAAPVAEKVVGLVTKLVSQGKTAMQFLKPDGTLTDDAAEAARKAGIDPDDLLKVMQKKYAEGFAKKGVKPETAREVAADEFGIKLTPGEAADDYGKIAAEQGMARDARGPLAGKEARKFYGEREGQIGRAKTGVQERVAEQQPLVESANEAANVVGQGARTIANKQKAAYKGAYDEALAKEGEFNDIAFRDIGERIRRDGLKAPEPVIIDDVTTPVSARAIQHLDNTIGKLKIQDRAQPKSMEARTAGEYQWPGEPQRLPGATPGPDVIAGVNMNGVEQSRKQLVEFYKGAKSSGNASDIRAMRRIIEGFDDELETAIATGLFKGDDQALPALKRARALFSNYQKTFRSQGQGDSVGKAMEKIIERDATGGEIANMLFGKAAIGEKGDSVRLAARLKNIFGESSEEWSAIRQGLWLRLTSQPEGVTDFGPQALSTRISKFLSGDGADMAKVLFSPKELGEMRRFATVMKTITPPVGTVNHSNTYYALARELGIGTALGGGAYWLTNDPVTAAALSGTKIGGKLVREVYRGRSAAKYFSRGVQPDKVKVPGLSGPIGVGAGAAAGQTQ